MTFQETEADVDVVEQEAPSAPTVNLARIDTLHELLALAIGDFERVLADDRYAIDMTVWHGPEDHDDGRCHVCLAGSVIAKTIALDPSVDVDDESVDGDLLFGAGAISNRLFALNSLRSGQVERAWHFMRWPASLEQHAPAVAVDLQHRWWHTIPSHVANARGRSQGRVLLSLMKGLHADLVEAGL